MRFSKAHNQRVHAERRAIERFGVLLDIPQAVKDIQSGKATFVERQSLRCTVWKITQQDKEMVVVYDKNRKMIVTVLPEDLTDPFYNETTNRR